MEMCNIGSYDLSEVFVYYPNGNHYNNCMLFVLTTASCFVISDETNF